MRILVLIKGVPDTASQLRIDMNNKHILTDELEYIVNPYDEFALEEAVKLKELSGGEVVAVSMGDGQAAKCLRHALAVGADSAVLVQVSAATRITPRHTAKVLAAVIRDLVPDVVFAGKQAIDDAAAQVPERIAELLDLPHVSAITGFALEGRRVMVERQVEGGHYIAETILPAVFTTEKGLNTPRYPKLPDILKAKRKAIVERPLETLAPELGEIAPGIETLSVHLQRQQRTATLLKGTPGEQVAQLLPALRSGGVL